MKVKLNKRQLVIGVVAILVVLAGLAVGRSAKEPGPGTLDDPAARACTRFDDGYPGAKTKTSRLRLADEVVQFTADTGNERIADRAAAVGRSANDATADWKAGAAEFTKACRDAGWKPS
ncbi:hypothetical protein Asp14428_56530 [Actinoplanes sp. NBRC 14428]|uniref:Uncharacterized protein n=1 Tax=Pseudosporangium ferrugineum TaxID=439699 RepID=A0A2T0RDP0_9ACTN|nr:hypothetical protein [Pseudosporangium ferrugineum]PRY19249.1 hypothetical protein CLV70_13612 [Pseudosporangium ferrugineum]BCJ54178.1 hypothetical protein Asp14428_56530 [Actinoplanes sp. NBRC 14428]